MNEGEGVSPAIICHPQDLEVMDRVLSPVPKLRKRCVQQMGKHGFVEKSGGKITQDPGVIC